MLRPVYRLRLGDQVVDTTDAPRASTVVELVVCLDMDTPADRLTLVLARVGELRPERGEEMVVELGWSGEPHGARRRDRPGPHPGGRP